MSSILNVKQYTTDYFSGDGETTVFTLEHTPVTVKSVRYEASDLESTEYSIDKTNRTITFVNAPAEGENTIEVNYSYYSELPMLKGRNGKSPYQVAKENGYNKTEAEFNTELASLSQYLRLDGGTIEGDLKIKRLVLSSDNFGEALPSVEDSVDGQLFFLEIKE